jgi:tetratricopeptide (TPR) repeat protein
MEETRLPENDGLAEPKGCVNCGSIHVVPKYPTALCSDCRQLFIKYPISLPVKLFGIGVALVLIFALFSFPENISTGIHLERAREYEKKKQYISAQREYTEVLRVEPDNLDVNAHLMIAAFYNLDITTFVKTQERLIGKNFSDERLFNEVNDMLNRLKAMVTDEGIDNILLRYNNNEDAVPDSAFTNYLKDNPDNVCALAMYAKRLYSRKDFMHCDTLAQRILGIDIENLFALRMLATIEREKEHMEESIAYCNRIIEMNSEAGYAYASMARTYLRWNKPVQGLKMAEKSMAIDSNDPYNKVTMAIAWHLNKQPLKRDALLKELKQHADTTTAGHLKYAMDVINQKQSI